MKTSPTTRSRQRRATSFWGPLFERRDETVTAPKAASKPSKPFNWEFRTPLVFWLVTAALAIAIVALLAVGEPTFGQ